MTQLRVGINSESLAIWQANDCEHLRYEYDLTPADVVIDIGAYRGEWAAEIFRRYGCKIICIEPTPYMDFQQCEWIRAAASDHEGTMGFGGAYYYSSAHEEPNTTYPCIDINSVLARFDEIALCKINIEGHEYPLLRHIIAGGFQRRVRDFQIQFHEIQGDPFEVRYKAVTKELAESHDLEWRYSFVWEDWKRRE